MSTGVPNANISAGSGGSSLGRKLEAAASKIHGAGEQIRGEFNTAVNTAAGDRTGAARDQATIEKGNAEMQTGRFSERKLNPKFSSDTTAAPTTRESGGVNTGAGVSEGVAANRSTGAGGRLV